MSNYDDSTNSMTKLELISVKMMTGLLASGEMANAESDFSNNEGADIAAVLAIKYAKSLIRLLDEAEKAEKEKLKTKIDKTEDDFNLSRLIDKAFGNKKESTPFSYERAFKIINEDQPTQKAIDEALEIVENFYSTSNVYINTENGKSCIDAENFKKMYDEIKSLKNKR